MEIREEEVYLQRESDAEGDIMVYVGRGWYIEMKRGIDREVWYCREIEGSTLRVRMERAN